ncbi:LysM peptidoglycan-binding domain-containing protein [Shewanella sp. NIFS-20-20]|uniref:LysM peptidoglycan-binding domain-containing protein n=1 Tax=Shewanella sp. NIFS-20-20 TaxID=2853806 RepID=UPI001C4882E1|nr:LysM peptidoglycan-binding domain-containing protein [Shewanella sp. NIFS-20-20]MBV7315563.1 LysM peptidoglycan-binding domain-containing protein [Shewanella sp. NIFS-20-20]
MKRLLLSVTLLLSAAPLHADTITLKPGHPETYVVEKGDTLWDISAHFLQNPWRWPTLWGANPQIANPHLIFPGDKLTLVFIDGQPRLVKKPMLSKQPQGRIQPKGGAIPVVDLALIRPYLLHNRVVDADWLAQQPMVLGGESPSRHHVANEIIYIASAMTLGAKVGLYQQGREFVRSHDGSELGQEAILTATGRVIETGDVSKVELLSSYRETKPGDRVLALEDDSLMSAQFMPKAASTSQAKILASAINMREMGKLDVAYIDRGQLDGVSAGDVFAISRDGDVVVINKEGVPVPSSDRTTYDEVVAMISDDRSKQMPATYRGNIMVFKTFDNTSLGLIMVNERPVRINDNLLSPELVTVLRE